MNNLTSNSVFGDNRLDKRAIFFSLLVSNLNVSIGKLSSKWSEQIAIYRFLNNDKVT